MGSSEEQGEIAFYACTGLFIVTAIGLATAYCLSVRKARRAAAVLAARRQRKLEGKAFDPTRAMGSYDPTVVKARILNVWKTSSAAERLAYHGLEGRPSRGGAHHASALFKEPDPDSCNGKFLRATTLFRAEVLSVYEAYIELLRDITPPTTDNNSVVAVSTRAPELLEHLLPFIEKLEKVGTMMQDYETNLKRRNFNDNQAMHIDHATRLHMQTKTLSKEWMQIARNMPRLKPIKDGRFDRGWDLRGPRRDALESRLAQHLSFVDKRRAGLLPQAGHHTDDGGDNHGDIDGTTSTLAAAAQTPRWSTRVSRMFPPQVRRHPLFYCGLASLYLAVMVPFLMGINQSSWRGLFGTFLPVPPQYCIDCLPGGEGVPIQKILVPIIFAFMHTAMLSLCLLPLPLCRGLLRDLSIAGANKRGIFPVEDAVWLHKLFGVLMLAALFIAPFFWLVAMGSTCLGTSTNEQVAIVKACSAFNPFVFDAKAGPIPPANNVSQHVIMTDLVFDSFEGASFFDARDNVLFLRAVAWPLFFGVTPWILRRGDMTFPTWMPSFIVRNWFEIVTYSHYFVAWAAIALAVYARFEVFFFAIIGFGLLIIEKAREWTFHAYTVPIQFGKNATSDTYTLLHRSSVDERPTAVEVVIKRPKGFNFTAGQYLFIKVPTIDSVWHAFSLASCPADDAIHLHMGVIGGQPNNWIKPTDADPDFRQRNPTWTYKLFAAIRDRYESGKDYDPIRAVVRGPYGSPFQSCFTRRYKACVLVGSGTGLTSALSVLKEVIERRRDGRDTSDKVWFVWSCRNVRDLRWCWRTLQQAVVEACRTGAIDVPEGWSAATSASLDWLGVSIFVSQANKNDLLSFLGYSDVESSDALHHGGGFDELDYHATDVVTGGAALQKLTDKPDDETKRSKSHCSIRLPKASALTALPKPTHPTITMSDNDVDDLPPTPEDTQHRKEHHGRNGHAQPPSQVGRGSDVDNDDDDDDDDYETDYAPPPIPPRRRHGAASAVLPLHAEMALLRRGSRRHHAAATTNAGTNAGAGADRTGPPTPPAPTMSPFWSGATTIDFSTDMYGDHDIFTGAAPNGPLPPKPSATTDRGQHPQTVQFEADFKLKMPARKSRRHRRQDGPPPLMPRNGAQASPTPSNGGSASKSSSSRRWTFKNLRSLKHTRKPALPPPPSPPPSYGDGSDNDLYEHEHEDYYVVSTSIQAVGNTHPKRRHPKPSTGQGPDVIDMTNNDIYVSSQQRDVLHTCPAEVKSVLKRVATIRAQRAAAAASTPSSSTPAPPAPPADDGNDALTKALADSTDSQLEQLVSEFLAAGGSNNRAAEEQLLINLLERSKGRQRLDIGAWLKEQVIATSMDTKGAHIGDLLHDLKCMDDPTTTHGDGSAGVVTSRGISVCYCGPSGLAQSLGTICRDMDINLEYMAHAE